MADQQELQIVIEAINKASAQLKQVEKDLGGLSSSVAKQGKTATQAGMSFNTLVGAFVGGNLIVRGLETAFNLASNAIGAFKTLMEDSVNTAATYEAAILGLNSVANSFGHSAQEATDAAIRLSADGLLTPAQAAESLKNVLAGLSGATVQQGEAMINAMKDTASFNRVLYDYGDAIINTTRGIRNRNSILTDSAGVQKNLSIIMQEAGFEIQDLDSSSKKYAATQALINGYMEESAFAVGDASKYLDTYKGKQTSLNAALLDLKRIMGEAVMPAFEEMKTIQGEAIRGIADWMETNRDKIRTLAIGVGIEFRNVVQGIVDFVSRNKDIIEAIINATIRQLSGFVYALREVLNVFQLIGNGLEFIVRSVVQASKVISRGIQGDFQGVSDAYDEWLNKSAEIQEGVIGNFQDMGDAASDYYKASQFDLSNWWGSITATQKEAREQMVKDAIKGNAELSEEDKKMMAKIAKENRDYMQAVEKRAKQFRESFEDLVIEHRDRIKELTADLATESKDYNEQLMELLGSYNEAMADIEDRHKEKTASIIKDMEDERKSALEEIEKITEAYNEEVTLIQREGEDRLSNLKAQLDRERALGANANQAKIDALEQMIAEEQAGLDSSLSEKEDKLNEEVTDINDALNDKLIDLQAELDAEELAYTLAFEKRKEQYQEDLSEAKEAYEEKRRKLQEELDKELAIQAKFADDFKRVGDKIAEDDLTRLVRKFEEEKSEMEREHQERLVEMRDSGFEGGASLNEGFSSGFDSTYPQVKSRLNQLSSDVNNALGNIDRFNDKVGETGKIGDFYTPDNYPGGNYPYFGATGGIFSKPTVVGEAGSEVVLPLSFPKRMAQIMKSMGIGGEGGGAVTQNFYVTVKNAQDVDLMMERAGFAMRTGGGYR